MKIIKSKDNQELKEVAKLLSKKGRMNQNKFITEGLRTIHTLMKSNLKLIKIYTTKENAEKLKNFPLTIVDENLISKISSSKTPSGTVGVFEIPEQKNLENLNNSIILYEVQDPGNLGTLIRTAAATNKEKIILINTCDVWSPKVIQSTAGNIGFVEIFNVDWHNILNIKKSEQLCALVVENGKTHNQINFKNSVLIVGGEAHGIPENIIEQCDLKLTLPMNKNVESLNAGVAGSIAMYLSKEN